MGLFQDNSRIIDPIALSMAKIHRVLTILSALGLILFLLLI